MAFDIERFGLTAAPALLCRKQCVCLLHETLQNPIIYRVELNLREEGTWQFKNKAVLLSLVERLFSF